MAEGIPIIRMTLEGMKFDILKALLTYEAQLADETRRAVEAYCTPENIERVITAAVSRELDSAIQEEVHQFYRNGEGRKLIAKAVGSRLTRQTLTETARWMTPQGRICWCPTSDASEGRGDHTAACYATWRAYEATFDSGESAK